MVQENTFLFGNELNIFHKISTKILNNKKCLVEDHKIIFIHKHYQDMILVIAVKVFSKMLRALRLLVTVKFDLCIWNLQLGSKLSHIKVL